jgi:AcrR family transcriptional regulator
MSRPKNADGQRTRQAILDAALDLFAAKGYFGASLRDVAAAVGVRESALYNYFPSKDALFEALIVADQELKTERLAPFAGAAVADGRAALEQFTAATLDSFSLSRQQQVFRILMSDGLRLARLGRLNLLDRMSNDRGPLHELLRRLIREGWLRDTDLKTLVMAFISPLIVWRHLLAMDADLPMMRNRREFVRQHVDQFLRGAAAPAARLSPPPSDSRRRAPRARTQAPRRPRRSP